MSFCLEPLLSLLLLWYLCLLKSKSPAFHLLSLSPQAPATILLFTPLHSHVFIEYNFPSVQRTPLHLVQWWSTRDEFTCVLVWKCICFAFACNKYFLLGSDFQMANNFCWVENSSFLQHFKDIIPLSSNFYISC